VQVTINKEYEANVFNDNLFIRERVNDQYELLKENDEITEE